MVMLSLAWTAALALLGLVVLRLRMPRCGSREQPVIASASVAAWH
jgi:hypothetical protein